MSSKDKSLICGLCNYMVPKIVPLYDHDQDHKLQMCCQKCKKKIKNNEKIIKFEGKE